jgi:hypothetical protein
VFDNLRVKNVKRLKLVKGIVLGIMIVISVGACYAAFLMLLAGIQLLIIPEQRAQLLGAGLIAITSAMVYYLVKFARWTYFLAKRW